MGHVRDRWTDPGPNKRRIHNERWGHGKRWQARWVEAGRERSHTFSSKDAAEKHLAEIAVGGLGLLTPAAVTFRDYAERWRMQQLHHRAGSQYAVELALRVRIYPDLGHLMLTEITRDDVQQLVVRWSTIYAPSTVEVTYGYVATVFKSAVHDRLVQFTPCMRISLPKAPRKRVIPLTVDQVATIAGKVGPRYRGMVMFCASTGLRGGELRGMTVDRIRGNALTVDRQMLRVNRGEPVFGPPKSAAGDRTVELGKAALDALAGHQAHWGPGPQGLVWTNRLGTPVSRNDAADAWRTAIKGMGLPERSGWHDLRHFNASLLISAGLSPRAVADRLGHADVSETLNQYAHMWPSDQERATGAIDATLGGL